MEFEKNIGKGFERYEFPLSEAEVRDILGLLHPEDLEGLNKIVITTPLKNEDHKRFGRYVPGKIYLFMHLKLNGKFIIECGYKTLEYSPEEFKDKTLYAILHEIGHHIGIRRFNTDSEIFADSYADGELESIIEGRQNKRIN